MKKKQKIDFSIKFLVVNNFWLFFLAPWPTLKKSISATELRLLKIRWRNIMRYAIRWIPKIWVGIVMSQEIVENEKTSGKAKIK